jgi:hypothetical protein
VETVLQRAKSTLYRDTVEVLLQCNSKLALGEPHYSRRLLYYYLQSLNFMEESNINTRASENRISQNSTFSASPKITDESGT